MPIHHVAVAKVSKWLLVQARDSTFAYIKGRLSEQMGLSKPALSVPDAKLLLDDYLRRFEERLAQRIIDRLDEDRLVKLNSAISQLKMATRVPIDHKRGYLERALGSFFDLASLPEGTTAGFPNAQLRSLACLGIAAIHLGADEIVAENLAEALCIDLDTARTWFGEKTIQTILAAHPELYLTQQKIAPPQQNQKEGLTPPRVSTPAIQQSAHVGSPSGTIGKLTLLRTLEGYSGAVRSVALHADGLVLASGGDDQTIKLWNVQTGQLLRTLKGHTDDIFGVALSADGRMLASGSSDRTIKLWDVQTGQLLRTLTGHTDAIFSVALSANGCTLASSGGYDDKTIKIWGVKE